MWLTVFQRSYSKIFQSLLRTPTMRDGVPQMVSKRLLHFDDRNATQYPLTKLGVGKTLDIYPFANDIREQESRKDYQSRSKKEFEQKLTANALYICVDKTREPDKNAVVRKPYPGHIACFVTDDDAIVVPDSFISLRSGKAISGLSLIARPPYDDKEDKYSVYQVDYKSFEQELAELTKTSKRIEQIESDPNKAPQKLLIKLPIESSLLTVLGVKTSAQLVAQMAETRGLLDGKGLYVLLTGKFVRQKGHKQELLAESVPSLNCTDGVERSLGLVRSCAVQNPTPQMSAAAILKAILQQVEPGLDVVDIVRRTKLIDSSNGMEAGDPYDLGLRSDSSALSP